LRVAEFMSRTFHFVLSAISIAAITLTASLAKADDASPAEARRAEIRSALEKQRTANLERFHKYRIKKIYPHNSYEPGLLNVWTDDDGHLCAVATMMSGDGKTKLVEKTAHDNNFVRIADVSSGPLIDWVLTSGLTQEEIVMIQQPSEADVQAMEAEWRAEQRRKARARKREDNRLAALYRDTEHALAGALMTKAGLDLAAMRVEQHPELVAALLGTDAKLGE
jgi:hypothetical protein